MFIKELTKIFWDAQLAELKRGYVFEHSTAEYVCLVCGESFTKGRIYPFGETLYEAEKFTQVHISNQHGSMMTYLLSLDKKTIGLTDHQKDLVRSFYEGKSDAQIAEEIGSSPATVRTHRFSLREKARQAKLLLAVAELMEEADGGNPAFLDFHRTARMVDERYMMTEEENQRILRTYFPEGTDGPLTEFPRKEKRKLAILRQIVTRFSHNRQYTEKEVNDILQAVYPDYVTIRRYLIEYGFLDRQNDGSSYWVKDK